MEEAEVPGAQEWVRRFEQLGIPSDPIHEGLREGQILADQVDQSHPRPYQGMVAWGETNGGIRRRLKVLGWGFQDDDNIPMAIRPDGELLITAISGNAN